jgi:hypothetical protein
LCEHREATISLNIHQSQQTLLDTMLHEILHAEFPMATERNVRMATPEILRAFSRIGFRLCPVGRGKQDKGDA